MRSAEQRVTVFHLRPLRTDELLAKQPRAANAIPPAQEISDGPEDTSSAQVSAACLAGLDGFDVPAPVTTCFRSTTSVSLGWTRALLSAVCTTPRGRFRPCASVQVPVRDAPAAGRRASVSSGSCPAPPFRKKHPSHVRKAAPRGSVSSEPASSRPESTSRDKPVAGSGTSEGWEEGDERRMARPSCPEKCGPTRRGAVRCGRERQDSNPRPPA
jgi:hypothetical protein